MVTESTNGLDVEVQYIDRSRGVPTEQEFSAWASAALDAGGSSLEMVIRVVGEEESRQLNYRYRGKDKPTNVLSFPFAAPPDLEINQLGDLVICAPVVKREAAEQHKKESEHWAHMVVHGVLHLQGYDHQADREADEMEQREKKILAGFGIADPYLIKDAAV